MADGRQMLKDEVDTSLSHSIVHDSEDQSKMLKAYRKAQKKIKKTFRKKE
jgi:hypothetical protein